MRWFHVEPTGIPEPFFTFKTTFVGSVSFSITKSGVPATWYMGDGTIYAGSNSVTHEYLVPGEKTVSVSLGDSFDNVTGLGTFANKAITEFDASLLNSLSAGYVLIFSSNNNLTAFSFPNNPVNPCSVLDFQSCNLSGVLDFSAMLFTNGPVNLFFRFNSLLTGFNFGIGFSLSIVNLVCDNCNISGSLDVQEFRGLSAIDARNNSFLTNVLFPNQTNTLGVVRLENCNITGLIDFTPILNQTGLLFLSNNPNLTSIAFGSWTGNTFLQCGNTGISTLDVSTIRLVTQLNASNCAQLSSIIFRSTLNPNIIAIDVSNSDLTGTLDLSKYNIRNDCFLNNNPNLEFFIVPNSWSNCRVRMQDNNIHPFSLTGLLSTWLSNGHSINLTNNNLSAAEVNEFLVNADSDAPNPAVQPVLTVAISGSNASPDSSSGGFDGVAAKASLIAKGYTVTTN